MKRRVAALLTLSLCFSILAALPATALAESPDPAALAESAASADLDWARAQQVRGLGVSIGEARLLLKEGVLVPAAPLAGRTLQLAFFGKGQVSLQPEDRVEQEQLELFSGGRELDETITRAFIALGDDSLADLLLMGTPASDAQSHLRDRAWSAWNESAERRVLSVDRRLVQTVLDGRARRQWIVASLEGETLGTIVMEQDADAEELFELGQWVPTDLTESEQKRAGRSIKRQQRKGRYADWDVDELGQHDTWVSLPQLDARGRRAAPNAPFEPEHYDLDIAIDASKLQLSGSCSIRLRANKPGRRSVAFRLSRVFDVTGASLGPDGVALPFWHERGTLVVALPDAPAKNEETLVTLKWSGRAFDRERGAINLLSTSAWYPKAGHLNRATYTGRFSWPKRLDLFTSLEEIERGQDEASGRNWLRGKLDVPVFGVTFELGRYKVFEGRASDRIDAKLALDPDGELFGELKPKELLESIVDSVEFYEELFGPYPLEHLTIVTTDRNYSQGHLGLITLTLGHFGHEDWVRELFGLQEPRTIIAHEVAHQWWGNLVGWMSYRDQWLSEALANYSTMRFAGERIDWGYKPRISPTAGWATDVAESTSRGIEAGQLGPPIIGQRLFSSFSDDAYHAVVYKKGSLVFEMIGLFFQSEEALPALLKDIAQRTANRAISTETFLTALEHAGGMSLDAFSEAFIYGTGLPDVYYEYEVLNRGGQPFVKGSAELHSPVRWDYVVVRDAAGRVDVQRRARKVMDLENLSIIVPMQIAVHDPTIKVDKKTLRESRKRGDKTPANSLLQGRLVLKEGTNEFELPLPLEPKELWLDKNSETYATFYSEVRRPRKVAYYRALTLLAQGRNEDARGLLREASKLEVAPEHLVDEENSRKELNFEESLLEVLIPLELSRLEFDAGRVESGARLLKEARSHDPAVNASVEERLVPLRARQALLEGDYDRVLSQLRDDLFGNDDRHSARDDMHSSEAIALVTAAAYMAKDQETYEIAKSLALRRGVDLSALEKPAEDRAALDKTP